MATPVTIVRGYVPTLVLDRSWPYAETQEVPDLGKGGPGAALLDLTPLAAPLISWSVARLNSNWVTARRSLLWTAWLPLFGLLIFIGATAIFGQEGPGPDAPVGWPNRFLVVTYCIWLVTFSWQALRLRRQPALARRRTSEQRSSTKKRKQIDVQVGR